MSDIGKFAAEPQKGHAWRGDWEQRVRELLARQGCSTVAKFLARHPTKSLVELADDLGPGDVAAVQLQWMVIDEAKRAKQMERLARDLLVRSLHKHLPRGWVSPADDRPRLARALGAWTSSIASRLRTYGPLLMAIAQAMIDENPFPLGWLPQSPDDQHLAEFFAKRWTEPTDDLEGREGRR